MCARYTLTVPDFGALAQALLIPADPELAARWKPRFNAAPGTRQLVLRGHKGARQLGLVSWGLVNRWVKDPASAPRHVNARAEGAREKPAFREAFAARRCVIPADGFYEWTGPKGARRPFWFHPRAGGLLNLAGLYEASRDPATGEGTWTFTVLTTAANDAIAPFHDRMPALLDAGEVDAWLGLAGAITPEQAEALLRPAPEELLGARPVSTRVNAVENDDAELLREDTGQLDLFGRRPGA